MTRGPSPRLRWGLGGRSFTLVELVTAPLRYFLHAVGPMSVIYFLAVSLLGRGAEADVHPHDQQSRLLWLWCCCEAAWFGYSVYRIQRLGRPQPPLAENPGRFPYEDRSTILEEVFVAECAIPEQGRAFISGWFFGAPYDTLTRGIVRDFIAKAGYNCGHADLQRQADAARVDSIVDQLEALCGALLPGEAPVQTTTPLMWLYIDSILPAVCPSPLFLSVIISWGINGILPWCLMKYGLGMTRVLVKPRGSSSRNHATPQPPPPPMYVWMTNDGVAASGSTPPPVIFFHGIGVGLVACYAMLKGILHQRKQPIWMVELPHISCSMAYTDSDVPTPRQTADAIESILVEYGYTSDRGGGSARDGTCAAAADFVGHSYGSVSVTHLIKCRPSLVRRCLLIDPICVGLHKASLCHKFVYDPPRDSIRNALQSHVINGGIKLVYVLMRTFWWWENVLTPSDIERISLKGDAGEGSIRGKKNNTVTNGDDSNGTSVDAHRRVGVAATAAEGLQEGGGWGVSSRTRAKTKPSPSYRPAATFFISEHDQYVPGIRMHQDLLEANRAAADRGLPPIATIKLWKVANHGDVCFVPSLSADVTQWCMDS